MMIEHDGDWRTRLMNELTTTPTIRLFDTGATRSGDNNKPDIEGFISPLAMSEYIEYMHRHRRMADGSLRTSDNWQRGITFTQYSKSLIRHVHQFHLLERGYQVKDWDTKEPVEIEEVLCAVVFNAMGYLHELRKKKEEALGSS